MRHYSFKTAHSTIEIKNKTLIMAVLNVTPDSFSDGGSYADVKCAVKNAMQMVEQGADIIDIGGESTRPGAKKVSQETELKRVIPVIKSIRELSKIPISIDTTKSEVARQAIAAGADIINDISAFKMDPEMKNVALETGAGAMLMHMRGTPQTMQENLHYDDLIGEIKDYFKETIEELLSLAISKNALMIDPGIGFSKNAEQNLEIINKLDQFLDFEVPILLGTSRKSFIGKVLGLEHPAERIWGTAASIAIGISKGAAVVRVHDIKEMKQVSMLTDAILNA
ncbi:MAG: dihydropteroate synthase [Lentisphaeraceae bacterium]|nr:dihydropteroate synthase [Lentisphaeraceae bacterium]